jgi:hypothetical protein
MLTSSRTAWKGQGSGGDGPTLGARELPARTAWPNRDDARPGSSRKVPVKPPQGTPKVLSPRRTRGAPAAPAGAPDITRVHRHRTRSVRSLTARPTSCRALPSPGSRRAEHGCRAVGQPSPCGTRIACAGPRVGLPVGGSTPRRSWRPTGRRDTGHRVLVQRRTASHQRIGRGTTLMCGGTGRPRHQHFSARQLSYCWMSLNIELRVSAMMRSPAGVTVRPRGW